jgi:hypothetical protein
LTKEDDRNLARLLDAKTATDTYLERVNEDITLYKILEPSSPKIIMEGVALMAGDTKAKPFKDTDGVELKTEYQQAVKKEWEDFVALNVVDPRDLTACKAQMRKVKAYFLTTGELEAKVKGTEVTKPRNISGLLKLEGIKDDKFILGQLLDIENSAPTLNTYLGKESAKSNVTKNNGAQVNNLLRPPNPAPLPGGANTNIPGATEADRRAWNLELLELSGYDATSIRKLLQFIPDGKIANETELKDLLERTKDGPSLVYLIEKKGKAWVVALFTARPEGLYKATTVVDMLKRTPNQKFWQGANGAAPPYQKWNPDGSNSFVAGALADITASAGAAIDGNPPAGGKTYAGNRTFTNTGNITSKTGNEEKSMVLPQITATGSNIGYTEYDIIPYTSPNRGQKRVILGGGQVYYTADHYGTFTKV